MTFPTQLRRRHYVGLFLAVAAFHFAGTWSLPLIDRDEPRFSEASREMLQRGDFVVPYFNNQYRFDKPPLTYWLQSSAYRLFGENEAAARLPSVLAAAGVAVILLAWGTQLSGNQSARLGWNSALIFTLCLQVALHAKAAVADMLLVFFVVLASWAGWRWTNTLRLKWWAICFGALALGFLAKGPIAWLPMIPIAMGLRSKRSAATFAMGVVVMLGLVALWGIPALKRTNGAFFAVGIGKHVVGRSVATMEGHGARGVLGYIGTLPFYFITIFASFAPWSWFLPRLIGKMKTLWAEPASRYLLLNVALYFGVFSLVKTKLPHYTLPAFPMLALLVGGLVNPLQLRSFSIATGAVLLTIFFVGFPLAAPLFPAPSLATLSAPFLKPEMEFASIDFVEPSLVWSFRKTVRGFHSKVDARKAAAWMEKPGARFYICPTDQVATAFPAISPEWKVLHHTGRNFAKGDRTDLTMLLKPE